ncbi:hypothetical protein BaRGS_00026080 [Batillaria attramentaria]|uniref:Uncharacterized protein n=1 Tax=Batillaria attramentaria TaxID=370345 RepID=A0ABD0K743_9CAEN
MQFELHQVMRSPLSLHKAGVSPNDVRNDGRSKTGKGIADPECPEQLTSAIHNKLHCSSQPTNILYFHAVISPRRTAMTQLSEFKGRRFA